MPKKKKWVDMEIARVKLNPEQAVLACCVNTTRSLVAAQTQCDAACSLAQDNTCIT